mmetsp:Transcript_22516/g.47277  ORF Transcript_22516/g.47277 Transcript_22516/m.47277 type:complete len:178 (+) Transcript_22516:2518-3051(+)
MISSPLSHLISSNQIQVNSLIHISECICSSVGARKVIVLLDITKWSPPIPKVGNPVPIDGVPLASSPAVASAVASSPAVSSSPAVASSPAVSSAHPAPAGAFSFAGETLRDLISRALAACDQTVDKHGWSVQRVIYEVDRISGRTVSDDEARWHLAELASCGQIFATIDENHFLPTN